MHSKFLFLMVVIACVASAVKQDNEEFKPKRKLCKSKDHEFEKYSKEANAGFDEQDEEDCIEEDEIIDESVESGQKQENKQKPSMKVDTRSDSKDDVIIEKKTEKPVIKPEDIFGSEDGSVQSMLQALIETIGQGYTSAFDEALKMMADIDSNLKNISIVVSKQIEDISKSKGKDLSKVDELVKNTIKDARKEFKIYTESVTENQVIISKELRKATAKQTDESKDAISQSRNIFENLQQIGKKVTTFLNVIPDDIEKIASNTNEVIEKELRKFETEFDVEFSDVIIYCQENVNKYNKQMKTLITTSTSSLSDLLNMLVTVFTMLGSGFQ